MAISINPKRIHITGGTTGKASREPRQPVYSDAPVVKPKRAAVNHFPAPETLRTLVAGAVEALRRGVTWDRGTILNILA